MGDYIVHKSSFFCLILKSSQTLCFFNSMAKKQHVAGYLGYPFTG